MLNLTKAKRYILPNLMAEVDIEVFVRHLVIIATAVFLVLHPNLPLLVPNHERCQPSGQ